MKLFEDLVNSYPFYQKARELWMETQDTQILKGLQKYPEPFTPTHWTPKQLLTHLLQESVDQVHYAVGLMELIEELEQRIYRQNAQLAEKDQEIAYLKYIIASGKNKMYIKEYAKPKYADLDD
jgi:hypothetical protein